MAGEKLDPIEIVELPDGRRFIQDGHHRYLASERTGIPVDEFVLQGEGPIGFTWDSVEYVDFIVYPD